MNSIENGYIRRLVGSTFLTAVMILSLSGCGIGTGGVGWKSAAGPLVTRWAKDVSPANAHREYPRPQMVRKQWMNLNGLWDYAIRPKSEPMPDVYDGKILVPFPVESALSGVMKRVGPENRLWYRRTFKVPGRWSNRRVLLHFEAVDWASTVWINGRKIGVHRGGYDPFVYDITSALEESGEQEIVVAVWDPSDAAGQPRGKQVNRPHKIWYTPTTGIWRTVWLEPVDPAYIKSLKIVADVDGQRVLLTVKGSAAAADATVIAEVKEPGSWSVKATASGKVGREFAVPIEQPKLWSPDSPYLYQLQVKLKGRKGKVTDMVKSYFGMRKVSLCKDGQGVTRLCLNNKPLFQYGTLDQGFWPDGLYTAPTDEALRYDVEVLKSLGCNMMRKHVKIEARRFYYWTDKLGILVWQDMPNGKNETPAQRRQFEAELKRMVDTLYNHPSIIMWVPFNEGWGQYDTERLVGWLKMYDPRRLVDNASGWKDYGVGDVHDVHKYPGPKKPENEEKRAVVLGEFGGLGLPIRGHTWQSEKNWGYRKYKSQDELTEAYLELLEKLKPMIKDGLSAAVYTQTTDVEGEVNGLMTYDREMVKMDAGRITEANLSLYQQVPSGDSTAQQ